MYTPNLLGFSSTDQSFLLAPLSTEKLALAVWDGFEGTWMMSYTFRFNWGGLGLSNNSMQTENTLLRSLTLLSLHLGDSEAFPMS